MSPSAFGAGRISGSRSMATIALPAGSNTGVTARTRLAECIAAYHEQGLHLRAVRLRVVFGEMMEGETGSFRERASFTMPAHWSALRDDLRRAGLESRLPAIPGS